MATNTPNYNLEKPAQTDFYDVDVQNANMDKRKFQYITCCGSSGRESRTGAVCSG